MQSTRTLIAISIRSIQDYPSTTESRQLRKWPQLLIKELTFLPKIQVYLADFPYLHYSITPEVSNLGDLMRFRVRFCAKEPPFRKHPKTPPLRHSGQPNSPIIWFKSSKLLKMIKLKAWSFLCQAKVLSQQTICFDESILYLTSSKKYDEFVEFYD